MCVMCLCVYVCIYIYRNTYTHICTHIQTHAGLPIYIAKGIYRCSMYTFTYIHVNIQTLIQNYICTCIIGV